jgi:hypothetical protein
MKQGLLRAALAMKQLSAFKVVVSAVVPMYCRASDADRAGSIGLMRLRCLDMRWPALKRPKNLNECGEKYPDYAKKILQSSCTGQKWSIFVKYVRDL